MTTSHGSHGDVPALHKRLRDVEHKYAFALVYDEVSQGHAILVAEADSGDILAWDGWYFDESDDEPSAPLADADWADWDDMPTKLLIRTQSRAATERMSYFLIPTFSPAREAAGIVNMHRDSDNSSQSHKNMNSSRVVAYLPIADTEVFETLLKSDGGI